MLEAGFRRHEPNRMSYRIFEPQCCRALVLLPLLGVAAGSQCAGGTEIDVRALAAGCASCHQPSEALPPPLAGQSRQALVVKLRGFRDGSVPGTVMPLITKGYTAAELDALARYFAGRPPRR
jgi:cytochrome subunit of sulfide dehydrogenase